jgi:outer membrane receptor protein involved in Fe transport
LNPFVDYSDSLNVRSGNPYLRPEFTNALELSYGVSIAKFSITSNVYYRRTNDMISRYRTVDPVTGIGTMTTINFSSSENSGAELVLRYTFEKIGSLMGTFNLYQSKIDGSNVRSDYQTNSTQWFTRLNANLRLGKNTSFQLTGNYTAPMTTVNGSIRGMSGIDAGIKQDIWGGKGSLSLNVTDIFKMRTFEYVNTGDYYSTSGKRNRESRVANFTFAYKFGKTDSNIFNRKKNNRPANGDSPGDMIDY